MALVSKLYNRMRGRRASREEEEEPIGLLLLGTGESGKSTLYKQFSFNFRLHSKSYEQSFQDIIWSNVIQAMHKLITGTNDLGLSFDEKETKETATRVSRVNQNFTSHSLNFDELKQDLNVLWRDRAIRECHQRGSKLQLLTSTEYLLSNVDRIINKDYRVVQEDILRSYVKTTGLSETPFVYQKTKFRVFDTGGQRSERVKWRRIFPQANVIIFVASLVEYDQILVEDSNTNRMSESLALFESICSNPCFKDTPIVLLLNKVDIFGEKLIRSPLKDLFPEYEGGDDEQLGVNFIMNQFLSRDKREGVKKTFPHVISAINVSNTHNLISNLCKKDRKSVV